MCGICGEIKRRNSAAPNTAAIQAVTDAMAHRGPDGQGVWLKENVCFGHRRLSIIDLDTGDQPMHALDGMLSLTYNGEIYNYIELREELIEAGQVFHTTSDTEIILLGYACWGFEVLERLNGMFAFALYDWRTQTFFAARDPIGQKPMLYHHAADGLIFGSELAPLLKHPAIDTSLSQQALAHYLIYENYSAPHTPLENVCKLPPGHALRYEAETGALHIWQYWDHFAQVNQTPPAHAAEPTQDDIAALESVLRGAVARHLRSDVPVGVYLSSGIDSSTMVTLACDVLGAENVRTYTIKHSEASFDEADEARKTAEYLGTQHHESTLTTEQVLKSVPTILDKLDEPLADPGLVSIYQVAEFASQHVKVVIAGDGGDEFFCGYPPFKYWGVGEVLSNLPQWMIKGAIKPAIKMLPDSFGYMGSSYKAKTFARGIGQPAAQRNLAWLSSFWLDDLPELMVDGGGMAIPELLSPVQNIYKRTNGLDPLAKLGYEYQQTYLPYNICAHTDKSNMMVSLEARAPFLDTEVMRYVNSLPTDWKLRNGTSKYILRKWLDQRLGDHVSKKRKQGFTVPLARWFQNELHDMAAGLLSRDTQTRMGIFNPAMVERLWDEHQSGKVNHYKRLWTLTVFTHWYEQHLA
jgi:asparagine synthase (glutamine-hydrolysing)